MKITTLIGALLNGLPVIAQLSTDNRNIYLKPQLHDYAPAFGFGFFIGIAFFFLVILITDWWTIRKLDKQEE